MTKKILIATPSFGRHGGIRVIVEWANYFARTGNQVVLYSMKKEPFDWLQVGRSVRVEYGLPTEEFDLFIITSPHSLDLPVSARHSVIFLQMMEHLFRPQDKAWQAQCFRTYLSHRPLISISRWNMDMMRSMGRTAPMHYVGNGINLDCFPIRHFKKDGKTILLEGMLPSNPTKDTNYLAAKAAEQLRKDGFRIIAYGTSPLTKYSEIVDKFVSCPSLRELNELYEEATILLKATRMDARSCSPIEAMTKGTVTVRAIEMGDDDLVNRVNCLRSTYNSAELYRNAKNLLQDWQWRERLAESCVRYAQENTWDHHMPVIKSILWDIAK